MLTASPKPKPAVFRNERFAASGSRGVISRSSFEKTQDGIYCLATKRRVNNSSTGLDRCIVPKSLAASRIVHAVCIKGRARHDGIHSIEDHCRTPGLEFENVTTSESEVVQIRERTADGPARRASRNSISSGSQGLRATRRRPDPEIVELFPGFNLCGQPARLFPTARPGLGRVRWISILRKNPRVRTTFTP
jgi:hypothetical protein